MRPYTPPDQDKLMTLVYYSAKTAERQSDLLSSTTTYTGNLSKAPLARSTLPVRYDSVEDRLRSSSPTIPPTLATPVSLTFLSGFLFASGLHGHLLVNKRFCSSPSWSCPLVCSTGPSSLPSPVGVPEGRAHVNTTTSMACIGPSCIHCLHSV